MGRQCTICAHRKRADIDSALVAGAAITRLAADFGLAESSVRRHRDHLAGLLVRAERRLEREQEQLQSERQAVHLERAIVRREQADSGYIATIEDELRRCFE